MTTMLGMPAAPRPAVSAGRAPLEGLRYVEAETFRDCDRTRSWCPDGHTGDRREQQLMHWPLFEKITAELGAVGYSGYIALRNCNEPLASPRLSGELERIAAAVPLARSAVYTNGGLLSAGDMERLLEAGVRHLRVTRYPRQPGTQAAEPSLRKWMSGTGLLHARPWTIGRVRQGLAARWEDRSAGVLVEVIRPDINPCRDLAGTAQVPAPPAGRTAPCRVTATTLSIDYRGTVKMCRNAVPGQHREQERYEVGTAADATLADLWDHPLMSRWRGLHAAADWSHSPACATCTQALPEAHW